MTSIISSMLQQLFPKTEFRCLNIGLDDSGKTTILYKLKLGEIVTTVPTIGFNVETVLHNEASLTIWDVGGCDKIRPLWRHYYQNTQAIIFILDTNDNDRFDEAMQMFRDTITAEALTDAVILCFLNKIDLCIGTSAEQFKQRFLTASADILCNRTYHIEFSCAPSGEGLYEGLDWLVGALRNRPAADAAAARQAQPPEPTEKERLESQLEEWLSRADDPAELFLDQLRDYTLDSWDHYTHLRIAYLLLSMHGRREGMKLIFRDIKNFIENSPRTRRGGANGAAANRGTTFHETMTYFWVHMVHYAMESSRAPAEAFQSIPAVEEGENSEASSALPSAWKVFLLMNPQLANGGLFLHYYSKQRMLLDPDSRTMVLLPDKVPLPSLLVDVSNSNATAASAVSADKHLPRAPLTDAYFLELLAQNKLPGWGHEVKLRVIYLLLCRWGCRSSKSVDGVLEVLQSVEKGGFHVSLSCFWIQMVTYHIAVEERDQKAAATASVFSFSQPSLHTGAFGMQELHSALALEEFSIAQDTTTPPISAGASASQKCMPFAEFLLRPHCQPLRNSELYSKYYSRKVLEAEAAASELALPDLKSLPSVV